jgi:CBS domain-containing protein
MTPLRKQTIASGLTKRVGDVAEPDFICLPEDMLVGEAVKVMRDKDVSSILVSKPDKKVIVLDDASPAPSTVSLSHKKQYVGILTERDILYRVMAENRGPYKVTLGRIMSSPLVTVNENATVRDAIGLMESKQIRRLPVVNSRNEVIGLVTLKTVIGNMPSHNIDLAELESSRSVAEKEAVCPYCRSVIRQDSSMAEHMSDIHMQKQTQ